MQQADLVAYLLARPGAAETHPFGAEPDVYKVSGKIFAILSRDVQPMRISLKCDPDLAEALRRAHPAVGPGYHLNKRHWNTLVLDDSIADDEVLGMIDHSYDLVAPGRHPRPTSR